MWPRVALYTMGDSTDVLLHDNADPDRALCRSAASYAAIWDCTLTKLVALNNTVIDGHHVAVRVTLPLRT
jgi:hypothetical protein